MLELVHKAHQGMTKSKQLARDLIFWPGINKQIEDVVSKCESCLKYQYNQQKEPMISSEIPSGPWQKIGSDLFELKGHSYLVIVDYYSNFIEVEQLNDTTSRSLIKVFKQNIARHGIPETLVSDNGPQYVSQEFEGFLKTFDITHVTSSPGYAQSNGQAEKAVQIIKRLVKKCMDSREDFYEALLMLRNTPRGHIGSPCERLFGRKTRTRIPTRSELLEPENSVQTEIGLDRLRSQQKYYYDRTAATKQDITPMKAIRMQATDGTWMPAEFIKFDKTPRSQIVKTDRHGHEYRRSNTHICVTNETPHKVMPMTFPSILKESSATCQSEISPHNSIQIPSTPMSSRRPPSAMPLKRNNDVANETPRISVPPPAKRLEFKPAGKRTRKQTQFYGVRLW